jgi:HK97 family phage major capsid protein
MSAVRSDVARELRYKEADSESAEQMTDAKRELARITQEIKTFATDAQKEIKATGDLSRDTKDKVDQALTKQTELQARLSEVEQKVARAEQHGKGDGDRDPSPGEQLINSEEYKALAKAGKGTARIEVKAITSLTGAAGGLLVQPQRLPYVPLTPREYRVRDLLAPGRTNSNAVVYPRELARTNNSAIVVEAAQKPESSVTFEEKTAFVKTIAHWIPASKQILDDAPFLQSLIDNILRDGLLETEDVQLLKGSGVGVNIEGIYTSAAAYSAPITIASPTPIDVLRLALLQAALTRHAPTGIVLNPADWALVELTKNSQGSYIFTNPTVDGPRQLWGKPVVETVALSGGEFLVGPFRTGAQILDREDANVQVSTEDRDNFIKNMVTVRAEERLALVNYFPASFIKGDLTPA